MYHPFVSQVSHGVLDKSFQSEIPSEVMDLYHTVQPYAFTNPYGLFRRFALVITTITFSFTFPIVG